MPFMTVEFSPKNKDNSKNRINNKENPHDDGRGTNRGGLLIADQDSKHRGGSQFNISKNQNNRDKWRNRRK